MWVIGAVSKEELKQISKMGYEITRVVPAKEFNMFADPGFKGRTEPDSEDLAMVYIDNDIMGVLTKWSGEERADAECAIRHQLDDARRMVIEDWWERATKKDLEMGRYETVDDADGWEHDGGDTYTRTYYVGHTRRATETRAMILTLKFITNSPQLTSAHVDER